MLNYSALKLHQKHQFSLIPFHNVETGNPILSPYSVQIPAKDGHTHTGTACTCRGHIAAPLVGLWIVSAQEKALTNMSIKSLESDACRTSHLSTELRYEEPS